MTPYFEIVTFFTLFVWLTPFCFFLSLSAGENVLPSKLNVCIAFEYSLLNELQLPVTLTQFINN